MNPRPEVWIWQAPAAEVLAQRSSVQRRQAAGERLPLAGLTFAVKDNIDVAGVDTTAGCPAFAYRPDTSAFAVQRLLDAGAVLVGKTNLDQFATGLVGTRSPYGAVRNAWSPEHISGGSSSGSGVAVALGLVDFALGTDTAGSGRIPAALNGVVGFKPTKGMVSTAGVVPACRSFDCVTVFARSISLAETVVATMAGPDPGDSRSRQPPADAPLGLPDQASVGYADPDVLGDLDPVRRRAYRSAVERLEQLGCRTTTVDIEPFLEAGTLLYLGGFVAERYAAVGAWVDANRSEVDPVVGSIISSAANIPASRLAADIEHLAVLAARTASVWADGVRSLLLPTAAFHPTLAEVAADAVGVNSRLGRYTTFANLLDLAVVSVPAGRVPAGPAGQLPFGVSFIGPAWSDRVQADLARRFTGESPSAEPTLQPPAFPLVVVGAHLSGQPLNHQLTGRGGRLLRSGTTAPTYRLFELDTTPPKPGLVRVTEGGVSIAVEVWELPPVSFADFVSALPAPMGVGPVVLDDGRTVTGFLCEAEALAGARDITEFGGWRAFRAHADNETDR